MRTDFSFPSHYEIKFDVDLPGTGADVRYFSQTGTDSPMKVGLLCSIMPHGEQEWYAAFEEGYNSEAAVDGLFSTSDPRVVCVVCRGSGFFLNTSKPQIWSKVKAFPILSVTTITDKQLLIFSDFSRLSAYRGSDLLWCSGQICSDQLQVREIVDSVIHCRGWNALVGIEEDYQIDLLSGVLRHKHRAS